MRFYSTSLLQSTTRLRSSVNIDQYPAPKGLIYFLGFGVYLMVAQSTRAGAKSIALRPHPIFKSPARNLFLGGSPESLIRLSEAQLSMNLITYVMVRGRFGIRNSRRQAIQVAHSYIRTQRYLLDSTWMRDKSSRESPQSEHRCELPIVLCTDLRDACMLLLKCVITLLMEFFSLIINIHSTQTFASCLCEAPIILQSNR